MVFKDWQFNKLFTVLLLKFSIESFDIRSLKQEFIWDIKLVSESFLLLDKLLFLKLLFIFSRNSFKRKLIWINLLYNKNSPSLISPFKYLFAISFSSISLTFKIKASLFLISSFFLFILPFISFIKSSNLFMESFNKQEDKRRDYKVR